MRPIIIGVVLNMFNQWTGPNFIFYRSQNVLKNEGGYNVYYLVFLLYSINFISTIICILFSLRKKNRNKTMMYIGTVIMFISLLLILITIDQMNQNILKLRYIASIKLK